MTQFGRGEEKRGEGFLARICPQLSPQTAKVVHGPVSSSLYKGEEL